MTDDARAEDAREMAFIGKPDTGFTAKRFHLLQLTERAASVVPGKNIYPLLSNFQVSVGETKIKIAATDMELSVLSELDLVVCRGPGTVLIPARRFLSIIREAAEGDVDVRVSKGTAYVSAGSASWELSLQPADDYPPLPAAEDIKFTKVRREKLLKAISLVKGAASRDGTNPKLMAVSISGGKVIASSHVRLHRAKLDIPVDLQVPIGAVDDLLRLLNDCQADEIGVGEEKYVLAFQIGGDVFMAGKLASEYPDQEKRLLTPHMTSTNMLTVDKAELTAAVRRVRITADPETAAIGLKLEPGKLTVISQDRNRNAAQEEIPAQWTNKERLVVVNHEHLNDLLGLATGPQVTFRIGDVGKRRSPLVITDEAAGTAGVIGQLPALLVE